MARPRKNAKKAPQAESPETPAPAAKKAASNKCPRELIDPTKGDKTPAVIEWNRANLSREAFLRKYANRKILTNEEEEEAQDLE